MISSCRIPAEHGLFRAASLARLALPACLLAPMLAWAQSNPTTATGTVASPEPTFEHLSIDWPITGDANNNGVVSVRFRAQGSSSWRTGMPLRRVPAGTNGSFSWGNRHSGSLFGLEPGTTYEIELSLVDPDGGNTTRNLTASTRSPMQPFSGGSVRQATTATIASQVSATQAGDTLVLAAGTYSASSFDGLRSGTAGRPITVRGSAGTVINGEIGQFNKSQQIFEDFTLNGRFRVNGSSDLTIRRLTVNASATQYNGDGIVCYLRCMRLHIADNTVNGTTQWNEAALGVNGNNRGEGILVTGPGHVIERNVVVGFRDGISFLEDSEAVDQYSIDVLRNIIDISADDAIEADFCFHNCRILGNEAVNAFIAFSSQPSLGGPTYFIRNTAYNALHLAFKLYRTSRGDVILHNTIVKNGDAFASYPGVPIERLYARNNLFLGGAGGTYGGYSTGSGRVVDLSSLVTSGSSLNYNGYGSESGFNGRIGATSFSSLSQMRGSTSEANGQQISRSSVFAQTVAYPSAPMSRYPLPDLRLAAGTAAVDTGEVIPNINDGFTGSAPDLGAFERAGTPPPPPPPSGALFAAGFED
jgi:hypothetical protein